MKCFVQFDRMACVSPKSGHQLPSLRGHCGTFVRIDPVKKYRQPGRKTQASQLKSFAFVHGLPKVALNGRGIFLKLGNLRVFLSQNLF